MFLHVRSYYSFKSIKSAWAIHCSLVQHSDFPNSLYFVFVQQRLIHKRVWQFQYSLSVFFWYFQKSLIFLLKLFSVPKEVITIFPAMIHVEMYSLTYTVIIPLA